MPSALYQKVRIPVTPADVIADGTIGLTMTTQGPAAAGATCVPPAGVASMRKIELDYRGTEVAPTTVGTSSRRPRPGSPSSSPRTPTTT